MTRHEFQARLDYVDLVHGVTVRAIAAFSDAELDFRPRPGMRTPRELIFHIYAQETFLAETVRDGGFTMEAAGGPSPEEPANADTLAALRTVSDLHAYAETCHRAAAAILRPLSEDDINRSVESPLGTYPAWQYVAFGYDEHWHHRGQLYTYLRLLGKEPPMLYDYGTAGT